MSKLPTTSCRVSFDARRGLQRASLFSIGWKYRSNKPPFFSLASNSAHHRLSNRKDAFRKHSTIASESLPLFATMACPIAASRHPPTVVRSMMYRTDPRGPVRVNGDPPLWRSAGFSQRRNRLYGGSRRFYSAAWGRLPAFTHRFQGGSIECRCCPRNPCRARRLLDHIGSAQSRLMNSER